MGALNLATPKGPFQPKQGAKPKGPKKGRPSKTYEQAANVLILAANTVLKGLEEHVPEEGPSYFPGGYAAARKLCTLVDAFRKKVDS